MVGHEHTCALSTRNKMKCFGRNNYGQLGYEDTNDRGDEANQMGANLSEIDLGSDFIPMQIALGSDHTCALSTSNAVKCFGYNMHGQLGYGDQWGRGVWYDEMGDNLPVIELGTNFVPLQITAGRTHTCILSTTFEVKCFGRNADGEIAADDYNNRGDWPDQMGNNLPVIDLGTSFIPTQIVTGYWHNCALSTAYTVKCWGDSKYGQLGYGDQQTRGIIKVTGALGNDLLEIDFGSNFVPKQIATGQYHTCALSTSNAVKCWGNNEFGQLGYGDGYGNNRGDQSNEMGDDLLDIDLGSRFIPTRVMLGPSHTCALSTNNTLKCWGRGQYGVLGSGSQNDIGDESNEMGDALPEIDLGSFTHVPTTYPTISTHMPTYAPTHDPTTVPSFLPSAAPTIYPTVSPTAFPHHHPSAAPTVYPTVSPTMFPHHHPSAAPTVYPTVPPTAFPHHHPSAAPTVYPTIVPTSDPIPSIDYSTHAPTVHQTTEPSSPSNPSVNPNTSTLNRTINVTAWISSTKARDREVVETSQSSISTIEVNVNAPREPDNVLFVVVLVVAMITTIVLAIVCGYHFLKQKQTNELALTEEMKSVHIPYPNIVGIAVDNEIVASKDEAHSVDNRKQSDTSPSHEESQRRKSAVLHSYLKVKVDKHENTIRSEGETRHSPSELYDKNDNQMQLRKHLNELWHETMTFMGKQEAFRQQSDVLNRLKSYDFVYNFDDYTFVLGKMLKIHEMKANIQSEDALANNIMKLFGFIVPQLADIEEEYENILRIYRKFEEIEKLQINDDTNSKFIHILDDDKHDEQFKNNEDNIIGDFGHRRKNDDEQFNNLNPMDAKCSRQSCQCLERIRVSLSYFACLDIQNEIDQNRLVQYCAEKHPKLIDDYIHIITEHKAGCDHDNACPADHCLALERYHSTQMTQFQQTDNANDHDNAHFVVLSDILDGTHCFLHHPDAIGLRRQTDKYNLIKYNSKDADCFLDGLCGYMLDMKVSKDTIARLFSYLASEQYDSDVLIYDVHTKNDASSSYVRSLVPDQYHLILKFITALNVRESSFSIGYRFYYWTHYKHPLQRSEYFQNKNDHSGYQPHELYIARKYASLKIEILQVISVNQYNRKSRKAKAYMNSNRARSIKAEENELLHYDVMHGAPLSVENLLCVIFYCDLTELCTALSATFRQKRRYEHIDSVKNRNKEFANWSRILRETVELFGMRGWEKRKKNEKKWNNDNNRIRGPFYCGMEGLMKIPEFNIRLCGPTSVSAQMEIASKFAGVRGIIITLNNNGHWHSDHLRIWDCSWLSDYHEDERLLMGGLFTIRIQGVLTKVGMESTNFEAYFKPLFFFDCMVTGISVRNHEPEITTVHVKHLCHLIDSFLNLRECNDCNRNHPWIHDTFRSYLNHRTQIIIKLHHLYKYFERFIPFIIHTNDLFKTWDCVCNWTANNVNNARCDFCRLPAPPDTFRKNNIVQKTVFQLFDNVDHVVIYATSGDGQQEYAFDLNNLLCQNLTALMKRERKIEIKATHQYKGGKHEGVSWLADAWNKKQPILQATATSMHLNISFTNTECIGARVYLEDTVTITANKYASV
eukprot:607957_1